MGLPPGLTPPSAVGSGPSSAYCGARLDPGPPAPRVAPPDQDPGAQFMAAHKHTDTLPLGSRPGKSYKRRGVQRFDPNSWARARPFSLGPPSLAPSSRGRSGRRRPQPTPEGCLALRTVRRDRGPALGSNRRPGCRMEAVTPRSAPPVWSRTQLALRSVLRLPPHQSRHPHLTPRNRPLRWAPRRGSWRRTLSQHRGPLLRIPLGACPQGRQPLKLIRPRRMGLDQLTLAHSPEPPPLPNRLAYGFVPCHGARAARGPNLLYGAASSP